MTPSDFDLLKDCHQKCSEAPNGLATYHESYTPRLRELMAAGLIWSPRPTFYQPTLIGSSLAVPNPFL